MEKSATTRNVTAAIPTPGRRALPAWRDPATAGMTRMGEADTIPGRGDRMGATADQAGYMGPESIRYGGSGDRGDIRSRSTPAMN